MAINSLRIPTQADIEDDMCRIHAAHVAHGSKVHCNYCDCECALCKKGGWKYRPEHYEKEILTFKRGEVLLIAKSFGNGNKGDEVVYMGGKKFRVLTGPDKDTLVTFTANTPCAQHFQRMNS